MSVEPGEDGVQVGAFGKTDRVIVVVSGLGDQAERRPARIDRIGDERAEHLGIHSTRARGLEQHAPRSKQVEGQVTQAGVGPNGPVDRRADSQTREGRQRSGRRSGLRSEVFFITANASPTVLCIGIPGAFVATWCSADATAKGDRSVAWTERAPAAAACTEKPRDNRRRRGRLGRRRSRPRAPDLIAGQGSSRSSGRRWGRRSSWGCSRRTGPGPAGENRR